MQHPRPTAAASLGLLVLLAWGCGGGEGDVHETPRSGVLITLDTTNARALDVYGADRGVTPNLARLAGQSVVYENARTVAPLTAPSHSSMLTGLYPPRHRVRDNGYLPLPGSAETLAERAREAGFSTAAFVSGRVLAPTYGLHQGFDVYSSPSATDRGVAHPGEFTAAENTRKVIDWLDTRPAGRPYFLWVHFFDAHTPYDPPAEFLSRFPGNRYLAEVAAMDASLGELIARLEREADWEETIVLVVADHGESLGRHGEAEHGIFAYDATIRVPLFVRHPMLRRAGERVPDVVSVVDAFPTLLAGMRLPVPADIDGISLDSGVPVPPDRGVYFESYSGYLNYGWGALAGWADASRKYIHSTEPELFDARADPDEAQNLYSADLPAVSQARDAIRRLHGAAALPREESERHAAETQDLTALGYAGAAGTVEEIPDPFDGDEDFDRPHPRTRLDEHARLWSANALSGMGRKEEAIREFRAVVADNPRNVFALDKLAGLYLADARASDAIDALERMLQLGADRPGVRRSLAMAHALLGNGDEAFVQVELYEAKCPPGDEGAQQLRAEIQAFLAGRR